MIELLTHPVFSRSVVLGAFGGIGLALTTVYSRRGPLIFPVYAAFLATVAVLLARYGDIVFPERLLAAMAGFVVAATIHYATVGVHANRQRRLLHQRYPQIPLTIPFTGHAWRLSVLFLTGLIASAGVAFLAS
ncbi:MAG TPA: hypothetical protein VNA04_16805 [Thermoanaerobaculia bacterium]|nr:hypothetical protein [Thermoanaerobaculia bacterium]